LVYTEDSINTGEKISFVKNSLFIFDAPILILGNRILRILFMLPSNERTSQTKLFLGNKKQMTNRNTLQEALVEAKTLKEAAIANAKEVLVETFTPHLETMYKKTLSEMEDEMFDDLEEAESYDDMDEPFDLEELLRELEEGEAEDETLYEAKDEEDEEKEEEESEEKESPKKSEKKADDDDDEELDFDSMSEKDLKDFIMDVVDEMIEAGEIEGGHAGMENEPGADTMQGAEDMTGMDDTEGAEDFGDEDSFEMEDDEELMEGEETKIAPPKTAPKTTPKRRDLTPPKHYPKQRPAKAMAENSKEVTQLERRLHEAEKVVKTLQKDLREINTLNAKLMYTVKLLQENETLNSSQKVKVLAAFDKAETAKEAKIVYETLKEGLKKTTEKATPARLLRESKNFASTPVTGKVNRPIIPTDDVFNRLQKLAGITTKK
jgi:hypothetical protein